MDYFTNALSGEAVEKRKVEAHKLIQTLRKKLMKQIRHSVDQIVIASELPGVPRQFVIENRLVLCSQLSPEDKRTDFAKSVSLDTQRFIGHSKSFQAMCRDSDNLHAFFKGDVAKYYFWTGSGGALLKDLDRGLRAALEEIRTKLPFDLRYESSGTCEVTQGIDSVGILVSLPYKLCADFTTSGSAALKHEEAARQKSIRERRTQEDNALYDAWSSANIIVTREPYMCGLLSRKYYRYPSRAEWIYATSEITTKVEQPEDKTPMETDSLFALSDDDILLEMQPLLRMMK